MKAFYKKTHVLKSLIKYKTYEYCIKHNIDKERVANYRTPDYDKENMLTIQNAIKSVRG